MSGEFRDFRNWNAKIQENCIDAICHIFEKQAIPYHRDKMNRPRQQITLLPYANHVGFATQTDALLAVFAEKQLEIEMLRNELYQLRGMTKGEWKNIEEVTEGVLHGTERN